MEIAIVSPLALQLTAAAEFIVTAEGPVIVKSDPLAAIELHKMGSVKVSVTDCGRQGGVPIVPIAIGDCIGTVNAALLPAATCRPQRPTIVLPSLPVAALTW